MPPNLYWGVTNIVCCIPLDKPDKYTSGELRPPTRDEAEACRPRLEELIALCNPDLIVALGDVSYRFLPPRDIKSSRATGKSKPGVIHLAHPSKILRLDSPSQQLRAEKIFSHSLKTALESL